MTPRPHSRAEVRKRAAIAFASRNRQLLTPRGAVVATAVREPDRGETPLSDAEVWHGVQRGLIATPMEMPRQFLQSPKGAFVGDHYARDGAFTTTTTTGEIAR
jgi:hypothetical protein